MGKKKKYELTNESINWKGRTLYRIKALKDFDNVKAGDLGGYIECEYNLSHKGNCWVKDDAKVYDDAVIHKNAIICNNAEVYEHASVGEDAHIYNNATIKGFARVYGDAIVRNNAQIHDMANIFGFAIINGDADIYDYSAVYGNATIYDNAKVYHSIICDDAVIKGDAEIRDVKVNHNACIGNFGFILHNDDYCVIDKFGSVGRCTTFYRRKDGKIGVSCGCFNGDIKEFKAKVLKRHGRFSKFGREYLAAIKLAKIYFKNGGYLHEK